MHLSERNTDCISKKRVQSCGAFGTHTVLCVLKIATAVATPQNVLFDILKCERLEEKQRTQHKNNGGNGLILTFAVSIFKATIYWFLYNHNKTTSQCQSSYSRHNTSRPRCPWQQHGGLEKSPWLTASSFGKTKTPGQMTRTGLQRPKPAFIFEKQDWTTRLNDCRATDMSERPPRQHVTRARHVTCHTPSSM